MTYITFITFVTSSAEFFVGINLVFIRTGINGSCLGTDKHPAKFTSFINGAGKVYPYVEQAKRSPKNS
jgi:hypothetical protein